MKMNKLGIIGGISPESTIEYYRLLIKGFRERLATDHYPELLLQSIDMTEMLGYVFRNELDELVDFLRERVLVLEKAGVQYVAMASNTPHLVFDALAEVVNVEMISIIEECCKYIAQQGLQKVGLLGTKSTMSTGFYQAVGAKHGVEILIPNEHEQDYVHDKYMNELVFNQLKPTTKSRLISIVHELQAQVGIEGVLLGGTELPLILSQSDFPSLTVFDSTQIHVAAILDRVT